MKHYDVWVCYVKARISYRATEYNADNPNRPNEATGHIGDVWAANKRQAISLALRQFGKAT